MNGHGPSCRCANACESPCTCPRIDGRSSPSINPWCGSCQRLASPAGVAGWEVVRVSGREGTCERGVYRGGVCGVEGACDLGDVCGWEASRCICASSRTCRSSSPHRSLSSCQSLHHSSSSCCLFFSASWASAIEASVNLAQSKLCGLSSSCFSCGTCAVGHATGVVASWAEGSSAQLGRTGGYHRPLCSLFVTGEVSAEWIGALK